METNINENKMETGTNAECRVPKLSAIALLRQYCSDGSFTAFATILNESRKVSSRTITSGAAALSNVFSVKNPGEQHIIDSGAKECFMCENSP